jgi:hypothetical protein
MRIHQPTAVLHDVLLTFGWLLSSIPPMAQRKPVGSEEFQISRAVCHGPEGRGNGSMVRYLTVKPRDPTQLARNNDDRFRFLAVLLMIDRRTLSGVHGNRAMPIRV